MVLTILRAAGRFAPRVNALAILSLVALALASSTVAQDAEPKIGAISGIVVDADTGGVVPDVEVRMFKRPPGGGNRLQFKITRVRSDADGRYRFENLSPGDYGIYAFHGTKASRTKDFDYARAKIADDGSSEPVDLRLTEALTLKVRVLAEQTGQPIEGAFVRLRWTDLDDTAATDGHGAVLIHGLTPHDQHIEAKAPGFQLKAVTQTLKDPLTEVTFKLPPGGFIQGKVVNDQGRPLAGVSIGASPERGSDGFDSVKSDEEGKFTLNYVPLTQSVRIYASLKEHEAHHQSISLNGAPYRPLEIVLPSRRHGGDADITVVDPEGQPVPGAEILNYGSSSGDYHKVKTNDRGECSITRLYLRHLGKGAELAVRAEGFAPQLIEVMPSTDGPARLTVNLEKGHRYRGRLVNAAGEPVSNASVYVNNGNYGSGLFGHKLDVDKEGRFSSTSLPPESTANISASGYTPQDQVKIPLDQEEEHVITLESTGHFRGLVTNAATGAPVRRFNVKLGFARKPPAGAQRSRGIPSDWGDSGRTINDDSGRWLWEELPNNTAYALTIEAEGFDATHVPVAVTNRGESDLEIKMQPIDPGSLVEVAGVILDPKGDPIEGVLVHLIGCDPKLAANDPNGQREVPMHLIRIHQAKNIAACRFAHEATTAADGSFRFPRVSSRIGLQLVYWGDETPSTRVRKLEERTAEQLGRLELLAPAGVTITGRINLKAFPDPGRVSVRSTEETFDSRDVSFKAGDDRSTFTIKGVSAGTVNVTLMSEAVPYRENGTTFYRSSSLGNRTVTAGPGETVEVHFE
ncbi:Nickel uptake substrate-specific transmembrane region [Caulifigura coniformis]|uniref:Nickel uptake substrate-specific transmembrane region n=1 Tax=Caulifigura coniformis TaxID=2527983 RepID=A0A517SMP8_9PLAN|nr:carboxypeptidase-like regulatory domain-containing protein [Caulifigura coniformis]QDT57397.1 Nickel uptake substrate-specific transmembrane region [Caulifigura coniformis]